MTPNDIPLGLKLSKQAGLNQTESDWLRFLSMEPDGCFVAEFSGRSVGTITTCIFDSVGWIAMLIVEVDYRSKGIGTELFKHSLNYLERRKVETFRLDATSHGQPIYEKLGFLSEYRLARYEGIAPPTRETQVRKADLAIYTKIIEFDGLMSGTNRGKMLVRLFEEFPDDIRVVQHGEKIVGYILTRPGGNAIQIGPCYAIKEAGSVLLSDALSRYADKMVFIDVPLDNADAVKIVESGGLRIQRYFMRMYRGLAVKDNVNALWAGSGPEKG